MPSQRVVRCEVERDETSTVRYVPMEIFGLWEHLMSSRHGFTVLSHQASLWIDAEESPDIRSNESSYDEVTEVTLFVYSDTDGMFSRVVRYFPQENYTKLRDIFLSHYPGQSREGQVDRQVKERPGVWIRRNGAHA